MRCARPLTLLALAIVTPLGFASKLVRFGPPPRSALELWINNSLGGVLYEVFWCLVVFFALPRRRAIVPICVGVFLVTTALEVLQLWRPGPDHPLTWARSTFLGRTLLGTTFSWADIPHYAAGCALGWALLRAIDAGAARRRAMRDERTEMCDHGPG